jgi:hypothetical protein
VQGAGRGRGVNRTAETPLDIDILADVVLPVTVNEVVQWEAPSEAVEMEARDGIALTSPTDMAKAWPDIWETAERARWMLRRLGAFIGKMSSARPAGGGSLREQAVSSLLSIRGEPFIGKTPLATLLYRHAAAGAHLAVAFFDPRRQPHPSAWLTEKLGALAERLHFLWQPHEIPPLAGAADVAVNAGVVRAGATLPWSTPTVTEVTDPVLVRQIHAECAGRREADGDVAGWRLDGLVRGDRWRRRGRRRPAGEIPLANAQVARAVRDPRGNGGVLGAAASRPVRGLPRRSKRGPRGGIRKTMTPQSRARVRSRIYLLKVVIKSYLYAKNSMKSNR